MDRMFHRLLPADVVVYAVKKRRRRYLCCLLPFLLLLLTGVLVMIRYYPYFTKASVLQQFFFVVFYLVSISFLTRFPFALIDKSYTGEIQAVTFRDGFDTKQIYRGSGGVYNRRNYRVLVTAHVALLGKGKTVTKDIYSREVVNFDSSGRYTKGALILFLDGLEAPYVFPEDSSEFGVCMLCGLANTSDAKACHHCQHTLLRKTAFEFRKEYEFVAIHKYRR